MNTDSDLAERAHRLIEEQKSEWPLLRRGYESLANVKTRSVEFDGFRVVLQFNPGRMVSSAAKVDAKSVAERKCFLCAENRPREQRAIEFGDDYLILANPFPIFPEHFTIAHRQHTAQKLGG